MTVYRYEVFPVSPDGREGTRIVTGTCSNTPQGAHKALMAYCDKLATSRPVIAERIRRYASICWYESEAANTQYKESKS